MMLCIKPLIIFGICFVPILIGIIKNIKVNHNDTD